jgi:two-component system chemotaxis response regulator CheB
MYPSMPRNAIATANPDHIVPLEQIADLLVRLTHGDVPAEPPMPAKKGVVVMPRRTVPEDHQPTPTEDKPGAPSVYTCPECTGTLWQVSDGEVERYECRVGHAYSLGSLVEGNGEAVEEALWVALRTLEESASLSRRMAERARLKRHHAVVMRWEEQARGKEENAQLLRALLARASEEAAAVNR